jgi:prolyl oligopeptidase
MTPPLTRSDVVVDTLHGVDVADPFRWLEHGDDMEVQRWVAAQNAFTRSALDARPDRGLWHERLVALMHLPVVQAAQAANGLLVLLERAAGEQQARLVARPIGRPDTFVVLADPSSAADDGAIAVDWFEVSPDGSLVAYGVSEGGTEDSVLRVARTADGSLLSVEIPGTRACSVAWEPDCSGFFYTRYPDGDQYHRTVHHHTLGDAWQEDPVVWAEHPNPQAWPHVTLSPCGAYLLVSVMIGWNRVDQHLLVRSPGTCSAGSWVTLIDDTDAVSSFVFAGDVGRPALVGSTTVDAPRGRLVVVYIDELTAAPDPHSWRTIVPERDVVLGSPVAVGNTVYVTVSAAAVDSIECWTIGGNGPTVVATPPLTSVPALFADDGFTGGVFAVVAGFQTPPALWQIDGASPTLLHPELGDGSVPDLAVSQVQYPSLDGTSIGLFLIHRADVVPDASTPTILNGYGGFAISESPMWSPTIAAWCGAGGMYAVAGLRGGYEHGEAWHEAGRRAHKQNVFDDFHAAADWLVATGRTSRSRLAIAGGSNGGLLVGVALTQRPDLCRAVWCAVPLLDMIRFPQFLIAKLWTSEYGDPEVADEFAWLHRYSPYHHVVAGEHYPSVLLTTAEGDSRVDPLHARKMAAVLQQSAVDQAERPILLHQEGRAGHGVGKPVGKRAAEAADVLTFFSWQLDAVTLLSER